MATAQKLVDTNKRIIEDIEPPAEKTVVTEETVLITDGWGAYNLLPCLFRQTCMAHLFRKIRHLIEEYPDLRSLVRFYSRLKRILKDGEKLQDSRKTIGEKTFWHRYELLKNRLQDISSVASYFMIASLMMRWYQT